MTEPTHNPDPAAISGELDRLIGSQLARVRRRFVLHGAALLLALPLAVVAAAFALDHFLRLPAPIRVFHTLVTAAVVALTARRFLVYPLTRRLQASDVAMLLERAFPELHERLVSAIQLKGALDGDDARALRNQSPAMIALLLQDAAQQAKALPLQQLFDSRRTARAWLAAGTIGIALAAGAASSPATAWAFLLRHLGRDVAYPRATTLIVDLPPASADLQRKDSDGHVELVVPAGADLIVSVLATGVVPDEVWLDLTTPTGEQRSVAMAPRPSSRFRHVFRRIATGFEFHARGGDDDRGDLVVLVRTIHPPQVAEIKAELRPPAYTRRPAAVQTGGAVEALIGTRVSLSIRTTAGVGQAKLQFLESGKDVPLQLVRTTDDAGTIESLVGDFTVEANDRYQVELIGEGNLRNPNPGTYPVSALQDYAPVGRWLLPDDEGNTPLLPEAVLCVRGEVRDDFGLASGTLEIDAGNGRTSTRALLAEAKPDAPLLSTLFLELVEVKDLLGAQRAADGLSLQVALTDNKDPVHNETQLPRRQVQIVDQTQLAAAIARQFRAMREETEQSFDLQTDRRARLADLVEKSPSPSAATAQVLTAVEVGQGRIQSAAERLHRGMMRAFDLHLWNRLDPSPAAASVIELYRSWHRDHGEANAYQPAFYRELQRLRREGGLTAMEQTLDPILTMVLLCDRLATETSPPVLRRLAEAQVARTPAELERPLHAAIEAQDRIATILQELLGRLDEWNDYQDLVQGLRALRDQQSDVKSRTDAMRGHK